MNRRGLAIIASLFAGVSRVSAIDVTVAPITSIANDANERAGASRAVAGKLARRLGDTCKNDNVRFAYSDRSDRDSPGSVAMAIAYAEDIGSSYLLYGYIRKGDYSVSAEIRLLDAANRSVIRTFYSSDGRDEEDRLLGDLAVKIVDYLEVTLGLPSSLRNETKRWLRVEVPASIGYWTPVSADWQRMITGTGAASFGVDLIPDDGSSFFGGKPAFSSIGLRLGYRYGVGDPETYRASLHSLDSLFVIRYHVRFTDTHEAHVACGLAYSTDIRSMTPLYSSELTSVNGVVGCHLGMGYRFRINDIWGVTLESDFTYQFYDEPLLIWSPRVGVSYELFRKERER